MSCPFLSDAPGGRLTVSMTEVVERKMGSEISAFAIDFLRSVPTLGLLAAASAVDAVEIGVDVPETGGVLCAENEWAGDAWGRRGLTLGL